MNNGAENSRSSVGRFKLTVHPFILPTINPRVNPRVTEEQAEGTAGMPAIEPGYDDVFTTDRLADG